jgi:hypothetical protein
MTDVNRLADLLLKWEESYERGLDVPAEQLSRDCPELVPALAERIAALKRMAWVNKQKRNDRKTEGTTQGREGPTPVAENEAGCFGPGAEPIPGYRLIRKLGKGGFGEVSVVPSWGPALAVP